MIDSYVDSIKRFVAQGGPNEDEWDSLTQLFDNIMDDYKAGALSDEDLDIMRKSFGDAFSLETMQGYSYLRPNGYSGDYIIIDNIYTNHKTKNEKLIEWDNYCQNTKATMAVRNRKDYFINLLNECDNNINTDVLNIASGPCRDLYEFYQKKPDNRISFKCIESDKKAIEYASDLLNGISNNISFVNRNAIRFHNKKKYDLIWSGGLFDYFDDKLFIHLIKRFYGYLKENGKLIIGNFSPANPTKNYMEFLKWDLNYRDEEHLKYLAKQCGFEENQYYIESEPLGINLFLHIHK